MKRRLAFVLTLAVAAGWGQARRPFPSRFPSRGLRGAVAGGSEGATEAGMRMFLAGGNAVDAGIATMLAASVVEFSHFGLGGEAPILVRTKEGKVFAIAGVGTMPKLGTADFYRKHTLTPLEIDDPPGPNGLKDWVPVVGILSALVPGMVDAAIVAERDFGTKSFAEVLQPAIDLADGFPLDEFRAISVESDEKYLAAWPSSRRVFLPNGVPLKPGNILRQPDLARTLRNMADVEKKSLAAGATRAAAMEAVRDYFYRGDIARRIGEFCKQNGGLLRYEDMAAFHVAPEEAVSTTFHGYTVYKPGFWSQGPAMIEALNILEGFPIGEMALNSADYIHVMAESMKLAYADRDTYYGDPNFNHIPADVLLSKAYGVERRKLISNEASLEFRPGKIGDNPPRHPSLAKIEHHKLDPAVLAKDTTCVDAIDRDGVAISITPSGAWMPPVIAGDTGIPLTQRAQSFLLIPGHPNELAPGKRPRVTLSPTIVVGPGKNLLTLSTPGGDQQDQALLQVLFSAVEYGMDAQSAVENPRFQSEHYVSSFDNHEMKPGALGLDERLPVAVFQELQRRGHKMELKSRSDSGSAPVIIRMYPSGVIEAGADPFYYPFSPGMVGGLFDEPGPHFDRDGLAERLHALAAQNIYIGGSSWKYEGWLGQIYTPERYLSRGRFSRQAFEQECLREYAETFSTVCGDFAFYQFPTEDFWRRLFARVPGGFRFAFKVPEQITCKLFPAHARYGPHAGKENEAFLDFKVLQEMFLRPLLPYRAKTAVLIFEFGAFGRRTFAHAGEFVDRLDPFLAALPPEFRYAVEIRNPEFLEKDYFSCLRSHGVAHVYNAWSKMPELRYQMAIPNSVTADFLVSRALLRRGRVYENAVKLFEPYKETQDPNPEARESMRVLIGRARENKQFLFLFVNNRLEGNAPLTILSLVDR